MTSQPKAQIKIISSDSGDTHTVTLGHDDNVFCSCRMWRFQKEKNPKKRTCKHIRKIEAMGLDMEMMDGMIV